MPVVVETPGAFDKYESAVWTEVSATGHLTVIKLDERGDRAQVAVYAPGAWLASRNETPADEES